MSNNPLADFDLFGEVPKQKIAPLKDKYTIPPFTVLSARDGDWQDRKRKWLSMGIQSEVGRDASVFSTAPGDCENKWSQKNERFDEKTQKALGAMFATATTARAGGALTQTSVFDPVLCELFYSWFCPPSGQVVDPFAGGSVRGIVASVLGYRYWGCDIRSEQVEANLQQAADIETGEHFPEWRVGDAMDELDTAPQSDFLFSCPPYGDLEVYSDLPGDISGMEYHAFIAAYSRIILKAVGNMKEDSFACFVVGEFRDKKGIYRGFVPATINAFESAGARLYNEAIFVTPVGSLPVRVQGQFDVSRKMGKTHQNILVFVKGCPRAAAEKINSGLAK